MRSSSEAVRLEPLTAKHWDAVRAIYLEGIATGNATFETSAPDWEQWNSRHLASCRLVALAGQEVVGFAALTPVSSRPAYAGVAEVSVYVAGPKRGRGVGRALLNALIAESEAAGIWTLQAGIFPENVPSIELHKQAGFRMVGVRERIGSMSGRWRDVLLMERRAPS